MNGRKPEWQKTKGFTDVFSQCHLFVTGSRLQLQYAVLGTYSIGWEMVREDPATSSIAALGWLPPVILLENYVRESLFSRWWMARYLRSRSLRRAGAHVAKVTV
jgi:hypothetical protein